MVNDLGESFPDRQDQALALGGVLVRAVREWADSAQPDVPDGDADAEDLAIPEYQQTGIGLARTIASYILATTTGTPGDLIGRLDAIRSAQPR